MLYNFKYLITTGKKLSGVSVALKKIYGERIINIHLQKPNFYSKYFDILVTPEHDDFYRKNNIIKIKRDKNNLSPLVVSRPKIPFLGLPPGFFFSQRVMPIKQQAIKTKKAAVCHVQAIHVINSKSKKPFSWVFATESQELAAYNFVKIILFLMQIL